MKKLTLLCGAIALMSAPAFAGPQSTPNAPSPSVVTATTATIIFGFDAINAGATTGNPTRTGLPSGPGDLGSFLGIDPAFTFITKMYLG